MNLFNETIIAPSTPPGVSAIAVIRLSGNKSIQITDSLFRGNKLSEQKSHTVHFGTLTDGDKIVDEVVIALFKGPNSFTKEDTVEISCHGSPFIVEEIIKLFLRHGIRMAEPGEFTKRAFLHGRFDLTQAEAVADLIHSDSQHSHQAAINQMRGGFSEKLAISREKLLHFASMVELELDFGEEDVEFADRSDLRNLVNELNAVIDPLIKSFDLGQVIKNGVAVVIAGKPNAGKSTLLNMLLSEEKAIVSDIAGTTRDVIEDQIQIEGINFRFIDTAGLRDTTDHIEALGVERAYEQMKKASIIVYLFDITTETPEELQQRKEELTALQVPYLMVANKVDKLDVTSPVIELSHLNEGEHLIQISAKREKDVDLLKKKLVEKTLTKEVVKSEVIITNARHYSALLRTREALSAVERGLDNHITGDLLAEDIRAALGSLGEITGEVSNEEILGNIFGKFCIGK
ncbi:MAG: tRNA uridine-5-carboxymethylaminomethyl(34) synthesis GTPase MnmE [Cyclobacteriaceae bacterium]|nr:tRNA uridine-5-carboxymethylaminomethyl(34) synthesis GTPase MnmE [Cyclobacteriaceae bacterium]